MTSREALQLSLIAIFIWAPLMILLTYALIEWIYKRDMNKAGFQKLKNGKWLDTRFIKKPGKQERKPGNATDLQED